ncbi:late expression factor 6 [Helicoverpa armigera NPV NNg1]|uniref:Late expression factor 6 n=5 Tax=Alphabaculovirus helarmigerae TaxID=3047947 RepID=A0A0E3JAF8_9ABAC
MSYVVYINGAQIEKRFSREFILFVCGPAIRDCVIWSECSRKRLVVTSRWAADRFAELNQRVFWPSGERFECRVYSTRQMTSPPVRKRRHYKHQQYLQKRSFSPPPLPPLTSDSDYTRKQKCHRRRSSDGSVSFKSTDRISEIGDWCRDVDEERLLNPNDDNDDKYGNNERSKDNTLYNKIKRMSVKD